MTLHRESPPRRNIAVVTGTRAEFGLLKPVIQAISRHPKLRLELIVSGAHLLPPQNTINEVKAEFQIAATIPMQMPGENTRMADARALGNGITGFAGQFSKNPPDVILVLGDRIEAFAAAAAAAVAGFRVAHLHGGDRAEGVADEAMRHAITKLAHIHLPATQKSGMRIIAMGEDPQRVHVVGSPAMDGLHEMQLIPDREFESLGKPEIVVSFHPVGNSDDIEGQRATQLLKVAMQTGRTLAMFPNHDPGSEGIRTAIVKSGVKNCTHLPREHFIGLLRRARVILGNSSAGLIEGAAIPIRCVNVGPRQAGREMPANVIDIPSGDYQTIVAVLAKAITDPILKPNAIRHPYGDGQTGPRIASLLAELDFSVHSLHKRNTY